MDLLKDTKTQLLASEEKDAIYLRQERFSYAFLAGERCLG